MCQNWNQTLSHNLHLLNTVYKHNIVNNRNTISETVNSENEEHDSSLVFPRVKISAVWIGQIFQKLGHEHTEEISIIWLISPHQWLSKQLINLPNSLLSKFESGDCHL